MYNRLRSPCESFQPISPANHQPQLLILPAATQRAVKLDDGEKLI